MSKYTCGFAFNEGRVLLVRKRKGPEPVIGKWNGVGGKVERSDATLLAAMSREFLEEAFTEVHPNRWNHRIILEGTGFRVHFLTVELTRAEAACSGRVSENDVGEPLEWHPVQSLWTIDVVPNLRWLIPLCMDEHIAFLTVKDITAND